MSKQQAIEFIQAVNKSQELTDQLKDVKELAAVITIAKQQGFVFNADDWAEAVRELRSATEKVLTDDDLEAVAGGTGNNNDTMISVCGCFI